MERNENLKWKSFVCLRYLKGNTRILWTAICYSPNYNNCTQQRHNKFHSHSQGRIKYKVLNAQWELAGLEFSMYCVISVKWLYLPLPTLIRLHKYTELFCTFKNGVVWTFEAGPVAPLVTWNILSGIASFYLNDSFMFCALLKSNTIYKCWFLTQMQQTSARGVLDQISSREEFTYFEAEAHLTQSH